MLNYKLSGSGSVIVLIHGLFGNLDNLGLLARDLERDHQVLSLDLRNHGLSFHSELHNYDVMAEDVFRLLSTLKLENITLIGHSMGGKVAMKLASNHPEQVKKLVVMDIAPVAYSQHKHDEVFSGLKAILSTPPSSRSEAMDILARHIEADGVRQFLGKSLYRAGDVLSWRFNVDNLRNSYQNIIGWDPLPQVDITTLFLKGANSDYLTKEYQAHVQAQFSNAKAHVIANTGHWLHAEKPQQVIHAIRRFIQ